MFSKIIIYLFTLHDCVFKLHFHIRQLFLLLSFQDSLLIFMSSVQIRFYIYFLWYRDLYRT